MENDHSNLADSFMYSFSAKPRKKLKWYKKLWDKILDWFVKGYNLNQDFRYIVRNSENLSHQERLNKIKDLEKEYNL